MYKKILEMTFNPVFEKYPALIKALAIYLVFVIGIDYINASNDIIHLDGHIERKSTLVFILTAIMSYAIYLLTAITTHRILILGEESVPTWGLFSWSRREWVFFSNALVIGIILILMFIPAFLIGMPFGQLGNITAIGVMFLLVAVVISRLSLVFPAISIDKEITLGNAWNYTKAYKLLVFGMVILFPIVFSAIFGLVYGLVIKFIESILHMQLLYLYGILNIVITVFTISALSAVFKFIQEEHPEYFDREAVQE